MSLDISAQLLPSILSSHSGKSYPANRLHILSAWCVSKLLVHRVTALLRPPAPAWDDGIQEGIVAAASHFVCILRHIGPSGSSKRARGSGRCSAVSRGFSLARKPLVVGRHSETPASQRCAERSLLRHPRGIAAHLCCTHTSSVCTRDKKHIYCCVQRCSSSHPLYRSMESMQKLHQSSTRDSETMDLGRESMSYGEEHLAEGGSARTNTIQTKGLFKFMDLPVEIRVHVCLTKYLAAFTPFLAL